MASSVWMQTGLYLLWEGIYLVSADRGKASSRQDFTCPGLHDPGHGYMIPQEGEIKHWADVAEAHNRDI